ncbi:uncharacterized protein A4U43_C08F9960 [Asparagus officinalis]|uniref:uncharacterized protein LOC109822909 n=1 Tax=Asparagus officinalis TaxID=4686 RepID=UPI00098E1727|nr:uncharacterized protein LOC109822909 [Asparagus officinalis]ONK59737.1 uncharacterized protein A4U43_C08F9960 [Asparagus officinalis]
MTMATSVATSAEPLPILSRVERLDLMMSYLEEIKGRMDVRNLSRASTTSSGTATTTMSDGGNSSVNSTPKSIEKRCRPIDDAVVETQMKGSLIERVDQLESRLLKVASIVYPPVNSVASSNSHVYMDRGAI